MKQIITLLSLTCLLTNLFAQTSQSTKNQEKMKLNAGIITDKLTETKAFYTQILDFGVTFENEFYLLLHTPNEEAEVGFLLPNHPSQKPIFQKSFGGQGVYLTIEVEDVDSLYERLKKKNVPIEVELKEEAWGDRHFAIVDPNGIGIDFVKYTTPNE